MKTRRPLQDTAHGQVRPWEGFRIIPDVDREATWLKVCENREKEASYQREAELEAKYQQLIAAGDPHAPRVLSKLIKERLFQIKRGWRPVGEETKATDSKGGADVE